MIIRNIAFTITLLTLSAPVHSSNETGFDKICKIYTEAKNSSLAKENLSIYIFENVQNIVNVKDAFEAHDAVFNLGLDKRFIIFKESAEYSLKHKGDCAALKS